MTQTPYISPTPTSTYSISPTVTATPGPYSVMLDVYTSSGTLVREAALASSLNLLTTIQASPLPYDPSVGPLTLRQSGWSASYDGRDSSGEALQNGVYLLVITSVSPGHSATDRLEITVLGATGLTTVLWAAPNPSDGSSTVLIDWSPASIRQVHVYTIAGSLVRDLGTCLPPAPWDLRNGSGQAVASGIYLLVATDPAGGKPARFKIALRR